MDRLRYFLESFAERLRRWRRAAKDRTPYVRRRQYTRLQHKYQSMLDMVHAGIPLASDAPIEVRKPVPAGLTGEVCLFVTHAPREQLKSHVVHHISHLLRAGVQVALVVNADVPLDSMQIDPALQDRLAGVYVRRNMGFDFGAWCHVLGLCDRSGWQRLYLVNDSLVGPVDAARFDEMMARIRASDAGLTGLTENPEPLPHLQSFFLAISREVLASAAFGQFVARMINFPDKSHVVEVYEIQFTEAMRRAGFDGRAVFADVPGRLQVAGKFDSRWARLLDQGFPYVKTRVLQQNRDDPRVQQVRAAADVDDQI